MTSEHEGRSAQDWTGRLSPSDVHHVLFTRAGLGRRGYDEVEVDRFLERVEQELTRMIDEKADLRHEVARLQAQLASPSGPRAASNDAIVEEAQLQAVRLLAAAQQTADTYVTDAETYSRRLAQEARAKSEQMVEEAREAARRMVAAAERLAGGSAAAPADGAAQPAPGPTTGDLERQVVHLETFGQVVRVQLRAYLEALLHDVEQEWWRVEPATPPEAPAPVTVTEEQARPAPPAEPAGPPDPPAAPADGQGGVQGVLTLLERTSSTASRNRSRVRKRTTGTVDPQDAPAPGQDEPSAPAPLAESGDGADDGEPTPSERGSAVAAAPARAPGTAPEAEGDPEEPTRSEGSGEPDDGTDDAGPKDAGAQDDGPKETGAKDAGTKDRGRPRKRTTVTLHTRRS